MHAVVFQVDMKPDWQGDADQELDQLIGFVKATPGFVRGTWVTDGTRGVSLVVYASEEAARTVADNASMPPDASATLRSVDVYEVVGEA